MTNFGAAKTDEKIPAECIAAEAYSGYGSSFPTLSSTYQSITGASLTAGPFGTYAFHAIFDFTYDDRDVTNKANCQMQGKIVTGAFDLAFVALYAPLGNMVRQTVSCSWVGANVGAGASVYLQARAMGDSNANLPVNQSRAAVNAAAIFGWRIG